MNINCINKLSVDRWTKKQHSHKLTQSRRHAGDADSQSLLWIVAYLIRNLIFLNQKYFNKWINVIQKLSETVLW